MGTIYAASVTKSLPNTIDCGLVKQDYRDIIKENNLLGTLSENKFGKISNDAFKIWKASVIGLSQYTNSADVKELYDEFFYCFCTKNAMADFQAGKTSTPFYTTAEMCSEE